MGGLTILPAMKIDYSELGERYSAMRVEDFELIRREDLADEARPYFDREKAKRVPGWKYEAPTREAKLNDLVQLQRQVKRRFRLHMGVAIAIAVFLFVIYFNIPVDRSDIRIYVTGLICIGAPAVLYRERNLSRRTGFVILWLRRFHRQEQKPFQKVLDEACMYTCMPITIQDTSLRNSIGFGLGRLAPILWGSMVIFVVVGMVPTTAILRDEIAIVLSLVLAAGLIAANWLGYLKFREGDSVESLIRLVEKIRRGKVRNGGVLVLRCQDSFWRGVVQEALRRVDAVVVDVSEPSENVIWELRTALSLRAPEGILLACAREHVEQTEMPEAIHAKLQEAIDVPLSRFPIFLYPGGVRRFEQKSFWISGLREALVQCMATAPAHED